MASSSSRSAVLGATAAVALTAVVAFSWRRWQHTNNKKPRDSVDATSRDDEPKNRNIPHDVIVLDNPQEPGDDLPRIQTPNSVTIVHGSVTGTAQKLALQLQADLQKVLPESRKVTRVSRMDEWDWWDELLNVDEDDRAKPITKDQNGATPVLILLLPTYTGGTWPSCAQTLQTALEEIQSDWRVAQFPLKQKLQVAIFGLGSSAYGDSTMGQPARQAVRAMQRLGAKLLVRLAVGDDSVGQDMQQSFTAWSQQLQKTLTSTKNGSQQSSTPKQVSFNEKENEKEDYDDDEDDEDEAREPAVMDLEDMGDAVVAASVQPAEPREMVTPSQAKALKKEGYQLIGTHSAVKLCRWTKHQLRGRGGCYKHTFYGITSYQCMEATPSLACANKVSGLGLAKQNVVPRALYYYAE
eukprot:scaffold516_cov175-Amphora_coffeaeformis.AAC.1